MRPCPGFNTACPDGAQIPAAYRLCPTCMHKKRLSEAAGDLWAAMRARELLPEIERYLSGWAAFRDYELQHPERS